MKKMLFYGFFLFVFVPCFGCTLFTTPRENPLITDYQRESFWSGGRTYGSSSLTAVRRMILFKLKKDDYTRICAEPPPAVGEELSKALQFAISANVKLVEDSGDGSASLATTLNSTLKQLQKSKGIQYEQDQLYWLCQMHMNNAMTNDQLFMAFQEVAAKSERILLAELANDQNIITGNETIAVSLSRRIQNSGILRMKLNDDRKLLNYAKMNLVFREYIPSQTSNEGWKEFPKYNVDSNVYSAPLTPDLLTTDHPELLEMGLAINPTPEAKPIYYPAAGKIVYYQSDDAAKATVQPIGYDKVIIDKDLIASIKLPKYLSLAYPNFSKTGTIRAIIKDNKDALLLKLLDNKYINTDGDSVVTYKISLNQNDINIIRSARADSPLSLELEYEKVIGSDVPIVQPVTISQFYKPDPPKDLIAEFDKASNTIKLKWTYSADKISKFKIEKLKSGESSYSSVSEPQNNVRQYDDSVTKSGTYTYGITVIYKDYSSDTSYIKVTVEKD